MSRCVFRFKLPKPVKLPTPHPTRPRRSSGPDPGETTVRGTAGRRVGTPDPRRRVVVAVLVVTPSLGLGLGPTVPVVGPRLLTQGPEEVGETGPLSG